MWLSFKFLFVVELVLFNSSEKISFPKFRKKAAERKPEKAQDAGAKARRAMKRREHAKYVSGSEDNVPDDIRDWYIIQS